MKNSIFNMKDAQILTREEQKLIKGKGEFTTTSCQDGQLVSTTITYRDNNRNGRMDGGDTIERVTTIIIGASDQQSPEDGSIGGC